jgi:hypothetical protein
LPTFIENLYWKRFRKDRPDVVLSIEERARLDEQKKEARRQAKRQRREGRINDGTSGQDQNNTRQDDAE